MSDSSRIRRQQILREAEGYLDLITVFGERMPCRPDARDQLARRVLKPLERIDNAGGLKAHVLFLRGQALRAMEQKVGLQTAGGRSEEHTSELQSHVKLVCRLLL